MDNYENGSEKEWLMMVTKWKDFRETLNITPEEEETISLEKALIKAVVEAQCSIALLTDANSVHDISNEASILKEN